MHCEVFAPSAAMAGGFTCSDVNELMPGCYDRSIMMLDAPGYGRPMGAVFRGGEGTRMFHPVYTAEEWLERMRRGFAMTDSGREEKQRAVVNALAREESLARMSGDAIMSGAIEKLRDVLDPRWRELFRPPIGPRAGWGRLGSDAGASIDGPRVTHGLDRCQPYCPLH